MNLYHAINYVDQYHGWIEENVSRFPLHEFVLDEQTREHSRGAMLCICIRLEHVYDDTMAKEAKDWQTSANKKRQNS
jgi:hypothetical protein